jgi:hypothetical protein
MQAEGSVYGLPAGVRRPGRAGEHVPALQYRDQRGGDGLRVE